ncbi:glycosyltransferase family 2 protein [Flavobacterium foetidum]|uniref:glycosyltransferase family 2 protein n=1 Tax=Flavobacterium foetidum TaxID=2026681 RepID=UPI001074D12A|nr:glycosyltransferase [Flavobacterium foetidum]KAF2513535.1 glycosyltransferase [Flavobacterium foetidum]
MEKRLDLSVIVLCYNQEQTIARAIDSVLMQQTEYTFEIIIGEDASPNDNTRLICEEYAEKYPNIIRLMTKEPNKGVLKNYFDCLDKCNGKYVGICSGDDWWHNPNKIQLQVDFLEKNKDYGLSFTDFRIVNVDIINGGAVFSSSKPIFIEDNMYKSLITENFISAGTVVFRKDLYLNHINFDKFRSLGFLMEDYPMWLEMIQHSKFKYIPIETLSYTIAEGSISNNKTDFRKTEKFENSVLNIKKYYIEKYPVKGVDFQRLEQIHHNLLTVVFVREGHFERAKYHSKFLINSGLKGLLKFVICHTSLIKFYSKHLMANKN